MNYFHVLVYVVKVHELNRRLAFKLDWKRDRYTPTYFTYNLGVLIRVTLILGQDFVLGLAVQLFYFLSFEANSNSTNT